VKIIIGITQDPSEIGECLSRYHGEKQSLTELGPFISRVEAINWLAYLKSRIGNFKEIYPTADEDKEAVWYGFTFEQQTDH
jgi:hypothetical protein